MVPNYLCCFRPNILGTLFTSPQIIFLHNLLEQLVSFSSNIPSFNRCRSATEMKGKLARRERKEVRTSFRHFGALLEPRFHSYKLEWLPSFWKVVPKNLFATRRVWRVSTGVKIDLRAHARKYYAAVEIYLKSQFKRGFTKMIVTRAGRLLE